MSDQQKLERYFRELTKWAERVSEAIGELEKKVGNGNGGRGPGGPPPPPDLGGEE